MRARCAIMAALVGTSALVAAPARAASNTWPRDATAGFSTPAGDGFWITYANGAVGAAGAASFAGDASAWHLNAPILAGGAAPTGNGYWLVGLDGGVFNFGNAHFFGSTGGMHLNQPVFAMTPTRSGSGYWLVARDGGVFTFGDAPFYGSTGNIRLSQPITGVTASSTGRGYRMVATDGGVFGFGDAGYYGSLPGLGVHVTDVVGMAPTSTNKGYWIVRRGGQVYSFGDAPRFADYTPTGCDAVAGIFTNPVAPGFRLVTVSGATIPFGAAPGGSRPTGTPRWCVGQTACRGGYRNSGDYRSAFNTRGPLWDGADNAAAVDLGDGRRLWLFGDTYSGPTDGVQVMPGWAFLRNTVAIQQGGCFEFRIGGRPGHVGDFIGRPAEREWYWPMDGVVDPATRSVFLSAMHATFAAGPPGLRWRVIENSIITLDLHSLAWRSTAPMPLGADKQWGTSIMQVDDWIYVYARAPAPRQYVARARLTHLVDGKSWQYFDGTRWTTNASETRPMHFELFDGTAELGPLPAVTVERYGTGYIASAKRCDIICDDVSAWYSSSPAGPWRAVNSDQGIIANTNAGQNLVTYAGHLVPTAAGWLAVWSVNRTNESMALYVYGPRVARPRNLPPPEVLAAQFARPPAAAGASAEPTAATVSPTATISSRAPTDLPTASGWVRSPP